VGGKLRGVLWHGVLRLQLLLLLLLLLVVVVRLLLRRRRVVMVGRLVEWVGGSVVGHGCTGKRGGRGRGGMGGGSSGGRSAGIWGRVDAVDRGEGGGRRGRGRTRGAAG